MRPIPRLAPVINPFEWEPQITREESVPTPAEPKVSSPGRAALKVMPTAILLGVTGVSRAPALVIDVQDGYFDRLLLTPVRRLAILLGHLCADVTVAAALTVPILIVGFLLGVRFESGPAGIVVFILIAAGWSLAFSGFGYAVALKTGNPGAVNSMRAAISRPLAAKRVPCSHFVRYRPFAAVTSGWTSTEPPAATPASASCVTASFSPAKGSWTVSCPRATLTS